MSVSNTTPPRFMEFFQNSPPEVNLDAIWSAHAALRGYYNPNEWVLPLPAWAMRPYDDSGEGVWATLQACLESQAAATANDPMCIYMHVPFCTRKCGFCDSYSFHLKSHRVERLDAYTDRVCAELELWSKQGALSQRPVSTVHLGGGTPAYLGERNLSRLVECCRKLFNTDPATEWALETTVESLTSSMFTTLHALGFRRLHLGVQSMQDEVRTLIGRKRPALEVIERVEAARTLDWIVSVDLICGLPGQTLREYMAGIQSLMAAGVDGFSLYELLIRRQNYRWAEAQGLTERSHVPNYWMFLAGAYWLEAHGFSKNLFNHWANTRDRNIYFTFPTRGEDLLAVGTIADGVFGDYHYRHPRYADYVGLVSATFPGLEGGLRRNMAERHFQPYLTGLLTAGGNGIFSETLPAQMSRWTACGLIHQNQTGGFSLTPSGSWFTGNMIHEARSGFES